MLTAENINDEEGAEVTLERLLVLFRAFEFG